MQWDRNTQPTTHCYGNSVGFSFVFTFVIISLKVFQCFCTYIIKEEMLLTSLQVTATARWVVTKIYFLRFLEDRPRFAGWRVVFFCFLEVIFLNPKTIISRTIVLDASNNIWKRMSIRSPPFPLNKRKDRNRPPYNIQLFLFYHTCINSPI